MIADAMEKYAEKKLCQNAKREHPNGQEIAEWDRKAEKEYEKNIRIIRKCNSESGNKARRRAANALDKLKKGKISVNSEAGTKAYTDRNRLMDFVYSTADLFAGRNDVTVKELVEACPPDISDDAMLKDQERKAENYIRHRYLEIIADNADEINKAAKEAGINAEHVVFPDEN